MVIDGASDCRQRLHIPNSKILKYKSIMDSIKICIIGLGYVGLPLARLFSTKYETIGFDMNQTVWMP